jgi:hypothetical protein
MVDAGIKQIRISKSEFPLVQITTTTNELLEREEVEGLHYDFRYRIVSEDKNRFSHWSEIIRYPMPNITTPFPYTASNRFSISKPTGTDVITAVWSFPSDPELDALAALDPSNPNYISPETANYIKFFRNTNQYDVWVRWNNNNVSDPNDAGWDTWVLASIVSSNNFSIVKKDSNVKRLEVAIQAPTTVKVRDYYNNKLTLFRGISGTI